MKEEKLYKIKNCWKRARKTTKNKNQTKTKKEKTCLSFFNIDL